MSTMTVKAGPLGNMKDYIVAIASTLSQLTALLVKDGVDVASKQPYIQGAKVGENPDGTLLDPVLEPNMIVTYNGKLKGN